MALGDLATMRLFFVAPSYAGECGLGFQCISPDANWRQELATEFRTLVLADWMACLGFNVACRTITVVDVVPGTGADAVLSLLPGEPHGTGGTTEAPAQLAYVISWRSDGIGRNTRGRNYLFGLPRAWITTTTWAGAAFVAVENLVEVILAQYGPTGFSELARLQVISRGPHGAPLATPQAFPITHAIFDQSIKTMRKRVR
jgi:hypothetical protein